MQLNALWIGPLAAAGAGAVALVVSATAVRREISELQRSLRTLRVPNRRTRDGGRAR